MERRSARVRQGQSRRRYCPHSSLARLTPSQTITRLPQRRQAILPTLVSVPLGCSTPHPLTHPPSWTKSQVRARAHPNMLAATAWLNRFYHPTAAAPPAGVDLGAPLAYADRFRMRHPGNQWNAHPPHVDGGGIERWEDAAFRGCFADILAGEWRRHDPYDLAGRINARSSLYGRENQVRPVVFGVY